MLREFFFPTLADNYSTNGSRRECEMRTDACTCTWMPRASIHASSTPRGCLSIFNLSIESANGRDIIAAGSIPRSTKGLDRIEIFEDEEPLTSGFPDISYRRFIFVRFCALHALSLRCRRLAIVAMPAALIVPCSTRCSSLYLPHFATYLFSSLRGGTL